MLFYAIIYFGGNLGFLKKTWVAFTEDMHICNTQNKNTDNKVTWKKWFSYFFMKCTHLLNPYGNLRLNKFLVKKNLLSQKLDMVGPVDNRPSKN